MGFWDSAGSALFGLGGSLLGGLFGSSSQSSANKTNIKLAQMNNQFQEKMIDKQAQYNIDQWNREAQFAKQQVADERAYNTASNQAARLREAGMNPALVMSGANAGTATAASTPSGNSIGAPSGTSVSVQPNMAMADAIQNGLNHLGQFTQIRMMQQKNDAEIALIRAKALSEAEETRNKKFQNELNEATKEWTIASKNEQYLSQLQGRLIQEEQFKLVKQNVLTQELINKNLPIKLAMEISIMASQRDLNKFKSKSEFEQLMNSLEKSGYKLSNDEKSRIFRAIIQTIETKQYSGLNPWNTLVGLLNR